MAVTKSSGGGFLRLFGLEADDKPIDNIPVGSEFIETDTGASFLFDGSSWFAYGTSGGGGSGSVTPNYELDTAGVGNEDVVIAGGYRQDTAGPLVDADGKITAPTFDEYNQMRVAAGQIMSSATVTTLIADTTTPVTVDARPGRIAAAMENTSSAVCYVLCDDVAETPSASLFTKRLEQYDYYELPCGYSGAMRVVWASDPGDGGLMLTEFI